MENTHEQNETLKPEQMESGKWYWVQTRNKFLIKFNCIKGKMITKTKCFIVNKEREAFLNNLCHISSIKSIRHATKEEVLKYFPDEVFEPIELRPEDLVSGDVYTLVNTEYNRRFTFIHKHYDSDSANPILYTKMYAHSLKEFHYNSCFSLRSIKIYHATAEEKKLLLAEEEPTDWEAKYNELKAKYDQLEPKGEKVYFYMDDNIGVKCGYLQTALDNSKNNHPIYEAIKIGVKKSILVNENS